ncbi:MAG: hypothetical protein R3E89_17375 [Thiolinea sp.]
MTVNDYTRTQDFTQAVLVLDQLGTPAEPFKALQGEAGASGWVDIPLLQAIHAR